MSSRITFAKEREQSESSCSRLLIFWLRRVISSSNLRLLRHSLALCFSLRSWYLLPCERRERMTSEIICIAARQEQNTQIIVRMTATAKNVQNVFDGRFFSLMQHRTSAPRPAVGGFHRSPSWVFHTSPGWPANSFQLRGHWQEPQSRANMLLFTVSLCPHSAGGQKGGRQPSGGHDSQLFIFKCRNLFSRL